MTRFVAASVSFTLALAAVAVVSVTARLATLPSAQQPPPPKFRAGVTVVPVDVRVLDREGKPVTDLEQRDFTVLEDGAPQEIRHFSARGLAPEPVPPEAKPAVRTSSSSPTQKQSSRIFLIMLGRGRLQYPSKGVDALIHFVRNRLLPQDQVAVMAFNRASEFTTNRSATLQVL
jgi:VWFA-related protein